MPAKSRSPEAAQKKLWRAELKVQKAAHRKICKDFRDEQKKLIAASEAAHREVLKFQKRAEKLMPIALGKIEARVAVLNGRLGL